MNTQYSRVYSLGYAAGKKIGKKESITVYTPAEYYNISQDNQHLRFMHWMRLKFHENKNWDSGISTVQIIEMFKNDKEFQSRYHN